MLLGDLKILCIHHLLTDLSTFPLFSPSGGIQKEVINSEIPKKDLAPNTPTSTQISVTGEI